MCVMPVQARPHSDDVVATGVSGGSYRAVGFGVLCANRAGVLCVLCVAHVACVLC